MVIHGEPGCGCVGEMTQSVLARFSLQYHVGQSRRDCRIESRRDLATRQPAENSRVWLAEIFSLELRVYEL